MPVRAISLDLEAEIRVGRVPPTGANLSTHLCASKQRQRLRALSLLREAGEGGREALAERPGGGLLRPRPPPVPRSARATLPCKSRGGIGRRRQKYGHKPAYRGRAGF